MPLSGRSLAIVGAPSAVGIRPYDDGSVREVARAPAVFRELGLVERLGAEDLGDVIPPPYTDFARPLRRPRNETAVVDYSRALGERIAAAGHERRFVLLLAGECSVVLGALLGARQLVEGPIGLAYVDAHADFATPEESHSGSVASMCLALAVGRGESPLASLHGSAPLADPHHVVLIGQREVGEGIYGETALKDTAILAISAAELRLHGSERSASVALDRLGTAALGGFWIHVDADVLDAQVMPAVDSPEPGGPGVDDLVALLRPLVHHPGAVGMELTIYDPGLDPDRSSAMRLVTLFERLFEPAALARGVA